MNSTTGAEATALSIALRVSVDRKDFCRAANRDERSGLRLGRRACEATSRSVSTRRMLGAGSGRTENADLENIVTIVADGCSRRDPKLQYAYSKPFDALIAVVCRSTGSE